MTNATHTDNELFEMVTEMVAGAISRQPGVLSIRSTDAERHNSGEVILKQLLITVGDDQFEEYLGQCEHRHGEYSMDGADDFANTTWTTWTPWSNEDLARFAVQVPEVSYNCDNETEFRKFAGELLESHAVLRHVFSLYDLQRETNNIQFVLAPENPEKFVERMQAIRIQYPNEAVQFLQYVSEEGERAFTDEDISNLTVLQKGSLFDPTTNKFVTATN
jgi:hypothetical protein